MGLSGVWTALDGFALMCIVPSIARFFACFCKLIFSCVCIFAPPSPYKCAIYRCKIARKNTLMAHPGTLPGTLTCARNFWGGVLGMASKLFSFFIMTLRSPVFPLPISTGFNTPTVQSYPAIQTQERGGLK